MRVFLCSFGNFSLAIPIDSVSSIMLFQENQEIIVDYDERFNNKFISLPLLFNIPMNEIKHGIILKNESDNDINDDSMMENRNILLTTKIECEIDISDEKIFSVPKIFNFMQFSFFINGIIFALEKSAEDISNTNLILLINPVKLAQNINKGTS